MYLLVQIHRGSLICVAKCRYLGSNVAANTIGQGVTPEKIKIKIQVSKGSLHPLLVSMVSVVLHRKSVKFLSVLKNILMDFLETNAPWPNSFTFLIVIRGKLQPSPYSALSPVGMELNKKKSYTW